MNAKDLETALQWRYATKQFDPDQKISGTDWAALEQAFLLCPSSYGLQPWKFIVVQTPELREQLRTASWNQAQVTDCSHYVVLLYKEPVDMPFIAKHVDRVAEVRNIPREQLTRYELMMDGDLLKGARSAVVDHWAKNQGYIAMGFVLTAAAVLKIDACPMEGLDPIKYDEILGLAGTGYKTMASIAFGYRHANDRYQAIKKVRFPLADIIETK
jgi:nitroreductase